MLKSVAPLAFAAALLLGGAGIAAACQPCPRTLSLEDTIAQATLIVVAERVGEVKGEGIGGNPEFIKVRVSETLKGETRQRTIRVRSMHGMCPYGISIPKKAKAVLYLIPDGDKGYAAVAYGCGVKGHMIEGGKLNADGVVLDLPQFRAKYVPTA